MLPASRMSWGSKVIMACISRMVAYVSEWYMLSLVLWDKVDIESTRDGWLAAGDMFPNLTLSWHLK